MIKLWFRPGRHSAYNLWMSSGDPNADGVQVGAVFEPKDTPVLAAALNFALRSCAEGGMIHLPPAADCDFRDPRCPRCDWALHLVRPGDVEFTELTDDYVAYPALGGAVGFRRYA